MTAQIIDMVQRQLDRYKPLGDGYVYCVDGVVIIVQPLLEKGKAPEDGIHLRLVNHATGFSILLKRSTYDYFLDDSVAEFMRAYRLWDARRTVAQAG